MTGKIEFVSILPVIKFKSLFEKFNSLFRLRGFWPVPEYCDRHPYAVLQLS
jgi:hypothetical protein